jgi:hypothetical protein
MTLSLEFLRLSLQDTPIARVKSPLAILCIRSVSSAQRQQLVPPSTLSGSLASPA